MIGTIHQSLNSGSSSWKEMNGRKMGKIDSLELHIFTA